MELMEAILCLHRRFGTGRHRLCGTGKGTGRFMTEEERKYAYFLCSIPGIGGVRAGQLLAQFGSPRGVYAAETEVLRQYVGGSVAETMERQKKSGEWEREYEQLAEKQIGFVLREEDGFPQKLAEIPDPPYGIFYRGRLPVATEPAVAVIGARECSGYGRYVAEELGGYLGRAGIQVISGMARGIDGISQQAALSAGGTSYGILGCGVDICYPSQNRRLYEELLQKGGLLSTYMPGTKPLPQFFPPRNRIVSGLSDALIVIEARQKSGTLITVDMALEQGKDVYVVPGRITDRLSDGCNRLLSQGAGVFLSPENFVEEFLKNWEEKQGLSSEPSDGKKRGKCGRANSGTRTKVKLPKESLQKIFECLGPVPKTSETLLQELWEMGEYTDISALNRGLMELELSGFARQSTPGYFSTSAN